MIRGVRSAWPWLLALAFACACIVFALAHAQALRAPADQRRFLNWPPAVPAASSAAKLFPSILARRDFAFAVSVQSDGRVTVDDRREP